MSRDTTRIARGLDRRQRAASDVLISMADDLALATRRGANELRRRELARRRRAEGGKRALKALEGDMSFLPRDTLGRRDTRPFDQRLPELVHVQPEFRPGPVRHTVGGVTTVIAPKPRAPAPPVIASSAEPTEDQVERAVRSPMLIGVIGLRNGLEALRRARGLRW